MSPSKRKKVKRRKGRQRSTASVESKPKGDDGGPSGTMSSLRGGFKGLVGGGPKKKESLLSKVITYLLIAAAVGVLIWRFTR